MAKKKYTPEATVDLLYNQLMSDYKGDAQVEAERQRQKSAEKKASANSTNSSTSVQNTLQSPSAVSRGASAVGNIYKAPERKYTTGKTTHGYTTARSFAKDQTTKPKTSGTRGIGSATQEAFERGLSSRSLKENVGQRSSLSNKKSYVKESDLSDISRNRSHNQAKILDKMQAFAQTQRYENELKKQRAEYDRLREEHPTSEWLKEEGWGALTNFNSTLASTADWLLPDVITPKAVQNALDYYKKEDEKQQKIVEEVRGGDPLRTIGGNLGVNIVQNVPAMLLAPLTAEGTIATTAGTLLNPETLSQTGNAITRALYSVARETGNNPMFWETFLRTAGPTYDKEIQSGADPVRATLSALTNGLLNAQIEIGGGIEKFDPTETFWKALRRSGEEEGLEEIQQYAVEGLTNKALGSNTAKWFSTKRGEDAVINPIDMAEQGAYGALAGGLMGGGRAGVATLSRSLADAEYNRAFPDSKAHAQDLVEQALMQAREGQKSSEAEILATNIQNMMEQGEEVPTVLVRQLHNEVLRAQAENERDFSERKNEGYQQAVSEGRANTVETQDTEEESRVFRSVADEKAQTYYDTAMDKMGENASERSARAISKLMVGVHTNQDIDTILIDKNARNAVEEMTGIDLPIKNTEAREILETRGLTNMVANRDNMLQETHNVIRSNMRSREGAVFEKNYDNAVKTIGVANAPEIYESVFSRFKNAGMVRGSDFDSAYDRIVSPLTKDFGEDLGGRIALVFNRDFAHQAFDAGRQAYIADEAKTSAREKAVSAERAGTVTYKHDTESRLSTRQKKFMTEFAKRAKLGIEFYDGTQEGEDDSANGYYENGVIHININSTNKLITVAKHELTHHIKVTAPEMYRKLEDFVIKKWYNNDPDAFDERVLEYQRKWNCSVEVAYEEIIANASEAFFTDRGTIDDAIKFSKKLGHTIHDGIRTLLDTFLDIQDTDRLGDRGYGEFLKELNILKDAQRMWLEALNESVERGKKTNGTAQEQELNNFLEEHNLERIDEPKRSLKVREDNRGGTISDSQFDFFKNSQAVDDKGHLQVVYHTTADGGFTVFDPAKGDDKISIFFSDSLPVSQTYAENSKRPIQFPSSTPADYDRYLRRAYGNDYVEKAKIEVLDKDGNIATDLGKTPQERYKNLVSYVTDIYESKTPQPWTKDIYSVKSDLSLLDKSLGSAYTARSMLFFTNVGMNTVHQRDEGYYECYLNLKNPLIVDAQGEQWYDIPYDYSDENWLEQLEEASDVRISKISYDPPVYEGDNFGTFYIEYDVKGSNGKWKHREKLVTAKGETRQNLDEAIDDFWQDSKDLREINFWDDIYTFYLKGKSPLEDAINTKTGYIYFDEFGQELSETQYSKRGDTRDIAKLAKDSGYDGVIIRNVVDLDVKTPLPKGASPQSTVYIAFSSNQVKDIYNETPTENEDIRFSKKDDKTYMDAVNRGDMETAQRMVEQEARKRGYDSPMLFHGTPDGGFTVFNSNESWIADNPEHANYFGTNKKMIQKYYATDNQMSRNGKQMYSVYLRLDNPLVIEGKGSAWNDIPLPKELRGKGISRYRATFTDEMIESDTASTRQITEYARKNGYDGVIYKNIRDGSTKESVGDVYATFSSNQIKSADPVTYDDNGNVIPLSERFNEKNEDIRYSKKDDILDRIVDERRQKANDGEQLSFFGSLNDTMPEAPKQKTPAEQFYDDVLSTIAEIQKKGGWSGKEITHLLDETIYGTYADFHFIERLNDKSDDTAMSDFNAFLSFFVNETDLRRYKWYFSQYRSDKYWKTAFRSGKTKFTKAIDKRIEEIMAGKAKGRNVGIEARNYTLNEAREIFNSLNTDKDLQELADKVFDCIDKNFRVVYRGDTNIKGFSHTKGGIRGTSAGRTIDLNMKLFNSEAYTDQEKAHTLLHESIHAVTVYAINVYHNAEQYGMDVYDLPYNVRMACDQLDKVYDTIKYDSSFKGEYGLTNVKEMVAELSNPAFRAKLKAKNLYQKIVDAIKKIFGIDTKNAYDAVNVSLEVLLNNADAVTFEQYAHYTTSNSGARYSKKDSDGNTITDAQAEYFKDSKARDKDGNLLVMYHSSPNKFTVFDRTRLGENSGFEYGNTAYGFFVTDYKPFSNRFGKNEMKLYANIEKPITHPFMAHNKYDDAECERITREWLEVIDPDQFETYEIYKEDEPDLTLYEFYMNLWEGEDPFDYAEYDRESLEEAGYDAVEICEGHQNELGKVGEGNDVPVTTYAVFNSNQLKNVDNENPTEDKDIRYSLSSGFEAVGCDIRLEDGMIRAFDGKGNEINEFTPEYIRKSPLGRLLTLASSDKNHILQKNDVTKQVRFLADLYNMILKTQDPDLIWAVSGTIGFDPKHKLGTTGWLKEAKSKFASITGNADPQYKTTIDFTTICVKTQAIIDAMSKVMMDLGRGLTEHEIIDIVYKETARAKEQVPCPVCYVFSRWVGLGNLLGKIKEFQQDYPEDMDMTAVRKEYESIKKEVDRLVKEQTGSKKSSGKARNKLYAETIARKDFLDLKDQLPDKKLTEAEKKELEDINRRLEVLDHWSWLEKTRLADDYKAVPDDVLFDLNAGRAFATDYPATWRFRTTRGPALGKAVAPYSPSRLGDTIRGIASPSTLSKLGNSKRVFLNQDGLTSTARKAYDKAIANAKRQNRMNGQRLQSTSDFRFEYALDYLLSFIELEAIGARAQMYTKVPEAVKFLASMGAEVNCSIMAKGTGLNEKGELVFSDITGMSWKDAEMLSQMYDNVQPILVAISRDHLIKAMAHKAITMIIPYHASGSSEDRYRSMMEAVGEAVDERTDFAEYENEHERDDATPEQKLCRNLRMDILTGKFEGKTLNAKEQSALRNNEILRQLYIRVYGKDVDGKPAKPNKRYVENFDKDGNDADCLGVYLTKEQAGVMMPYEYWDKKSTLKDADKQGEAYVKYCESLGITPVFSGWDSKGKYDANMDFTSYPGYWKTLIDRCMYNNDGTYHKQQAVNVNNVDLDMLDSEAMKKGIFNPMQTQNKEKTKTIAERSEARIAEEEREGKRLSKKESEPNAKTIEYQSTIRKLEKSVEGLRAQFKRTNKKPNPVEARRQAGRLIQRHASNMSIHEDVANTLTEIYEMYAKRGAKAFDDIYAIAERTAVEIVNNISEVHFEGQEEYKQIKDYLRDTNIVVSEEMKRNITDFNDFRKSHFGKLKLVNGERSNIDSVYAELSEMFPSQFTDEYVNPADQLNHIADVLDSYAPFYETLDGTSEEMQDYVVAVASDLMETAYNLQKSKTFADKKYDEKVKAVKKAREKALANKKEALSKLRARYNSRMAEAVRDAKSETKAKIDEKAQKKRRIAQIAKTHKRLADKLFTPSDTKHLPDGYDKAVANVLHMFDFTTSRMEKWAETHDEPSKRMQALRDLRKRLESYVRASEDGNKEGVDLGMEVDSDLVGIVDELEGALGENVKLSDLDSTVLEDVATLFRAFEHQINSYNRAFDENNQKRISDLADVVVDEAKAVKHGKWRAGIMGRVFTSNLNPWDFFQMIGGEVGDLYKATRKGFDKYENNLRVAKNFMADLIGSKQYDKWANHTKTYKTTSGEEITLTDTQLMSLYCLSKREQAQGHIYGQGVVSAPVKVKRNMIAKQLDKKRVIPTFDDVVDWTKNLSKEQIEVADKIQNFLSNEVSEWGNETSLKLYGYKKFTEKDYFPIQSSDDYLNSNFDAKGSDPTLKNISPTKAVVKGANNPLMLDDIFSIFSKHVAQMASYNGFVPAITDFQRVWNHKMVSADGRKTTVKETFGEAYGDRIAKYVEQFYADLNGVYKKNLDVTTPEKLFGTFKKSAVGGNLRVLAQQPMAIARAMLLVDPTLLTVAVPKTALQAKRTYQEMLEHCPIAEWKVWGFYSPDVMGASRDLKNVMLGKDSISDKVFMNMYGVADNITWTVIFNACKMQVERQNKGIAKGSQEYWDKVNDLASDVYDATQVVDSPFHRSELMKSQNGIHKMATAFMAEPTKTINMINTQLTLCAREISEGKVGKATLRFTRLTGTVLANAMLLAVGQSLIDAMRSAGGGDDDDDKGDFEERFKKHWVTNTKDNLNLLKMLPYVKDAVSIYEGFGVTRMDMNGVEKAVKATQALKKYYDDPGSAKYTELELWNNTAMAYAYTLGVPISNAKRDLDSLALTVAESVKDPKVMLWYMKNKYQVNSKTKSIWADAYYDALDKGNKTLANNIYAYMKKSGVDDKYIQNRKKTWEKHRYGEEEEE